MPNWDEINAQKRRQEERAKLRVSTGTSVQRITSHTPPRPTSLSDHKPSDPRPQTAVGDPLALVSNGSPVGSPLESASKTPQKRSRQLLKIRLEHADNVMNIVENWRLERQAAPKVAKAIQLLAAIEAGNTDYIRENHPLLVEALQKSKKRCATPSLKESYKQRESESEEKLPEVELLATALFETTGSDPRLNPAVYDLATQLHQADYTPDDVRLWYQQCWPKDWRGEKGDRPSLKEVRDLIGRIRSLPLSDDPSPADADNPYLQDEYFRRHTDAAIEPEPKLEPVPQHHVPGWVQDRWLAAMGQLEVQLNRATFDTWLKRTQPVHFARDRQAGTLYVAVPHRYAKEWIDKHLLTALNKLFDDLLNYDGQARQRISEQALFDVQIVVEGDPVPGVSK